MGIKDAYKQSFQNVTPDATLYDRTERAVLDKINGQRRGKTVRYGVLIAAMITLLAFTTVAFASGWIQAFFAQLSTSYPNRDFEAMEERAQDHAGINSVVFEQDASLFGFEVLTAYYDGERLMLATAWRNGSSVADLTFGPSSKHFNALERVGNVEDLAAISPQNDVSKETWASFEDLYRTNGAAGMMYYMIYLGDGVYVKDTYISPSAGHIETMDDGRMYQYSEFEAPLPQNAHGQELLSLRVPLYKAPVYFYRDGEGAENCYKYIGEREEIDFFFDVTNNHAFTRRLAASGTFETYSADIEISLSAIGAEVTISMSTSEEWQKAAVKDDYGESTASGVDYVLSYNAYIDDVLISMWQTCTGQTINGSLKVPQDASRIVFRPVYSLSGEHAEEDIDISVQ